MSGFLTIRKISMVTTMLMRSARYGTPHRVGGRVAATNSTSAASPSVCSVMAISQTPNKLRIQPTIIGAANTRPMPTMTPSGQPQEMRPAAAAIPKAITRSTATGVAMVMTEVTRLVAPVAKGTRLDRRPIQVPRQRRLNKAQQRQARAVPIDIIRFIRASPMKSVVADCRESHRALLLR